MANCKRTVGHKTFSERILEIYFNVIITYKILYLKKIHIYYVKNIGSD